MFCSNFILKEELFLGGEGVGNGVGFGFGFGFLYFIFCSVIVLNCGLYS